MNKINTVNNYQLKQHLNNKITISERLTYDTGDELTTTFGKRTRILESTLTTSSKST